MLRLYRVSRVIGDRYAGEWPREQFRKVDVEYEVSDKTRSQIYSAFEPLLTSRCVELGDHPKLIQQFIGLVRKGEKIDHAGGEHDDHCNSVAGACLLASSANQWEGGEVELIGF